MAWYDDNNNFVDIHLESGWYGMVLCSFEAQAEVTMMMMAYEIGAACVKCRVIS